MQDNKNQLDEERVETDLDHDTDEGEYSCNKKLKNNLTKTV